MKNTESKMSCNDILWKYGHIISQVSRVVKYTYPCTPLEIEDYQNYLFYKSIEIIGSFNEELTKSFSVYLRKCLLNFGRNYARKYSTNKHRVMNTYKQSNHHMIKNRQKTSDSKWNLNNILSEEELNIANDIHINKIPKRDIYKKYGIDMHVLRVKMNEIRTKLEDAM